MDGLKTGGRDREAQTAFVKYLKNEQDRQKNTLSKFMLDTRYKVSHMGTGIIQLPSDYSYDDHKPFDFVRAAVPFGPKVTLKKQQEIPKLRSNGQPKKRLEDINSREAFAQMGHFQRKPNVHQNYR